MIPSLRTSIDRSGSVNESTGTSTERPRVNAFFFGEKTLQMPKRKIAFHDTSQCQLHEMLHGENISDFVVGKYMMGGGGGYAVAQLVETLRYKPEGRRFDSR
jgi:hypothetical protein